MCRMTAFKGGPDRKILFNHRLYDFLQLPLQLAMGTLKMPATCIFSTAGRKTHFTGHATENVTSLIIDLLL